MDSSPNRRGGTWLPLVTGIVLVVVLAAGVATAIVRLDPEPSDAAQTGAGLTTTTTVPATTAPTAAPATDEPPFIREIRDQVAAIRGLAWKAPLNIKIVSEAELVRRIREVNARDVDPARQAGEGETLKLLHVIPQDLDYATALDDLYATLVLGFYDPITKEMFVKDSGGEVDAQTRMTVAHELDHALTDQHFDFGTRLDRLEDTGRDEEAYALIALVEGDARLVDERWRETYLSDDENLAILFGGVDPDAVAEIPPFLLEILNFPYTDGTRFVKEQVEAGGFAKLDQQYANPPTSTEQILHPERYAAGEGWAPPPLPDLAAATGCTPVHAGTVGEFQMSEVLDTEIDGDDARRATEGWNGDAYQVVRCGGVPAMLERWQGDDEAAAARLAEALKEWAAEWAGSEVGPEAGGRFAGPQGAGRIVRNGARVDLVLAGDLPTANRIGAAA